MSLSAFAHPFAANPRPQLEPEVKRAILTSWGLTHLHAERSLGHPAGSDWQHGGKSSCAPGGSANGAVPESFFDYLRRERDRLDRDFSRALSAREQDNAEVRRLWKLKQLVDDQMARWAVDLGDEEVSPSERTP